MNVDHAPTAPPSLKVRDLQPGQFFRVDFFSGPGVRTDSGFLILRTNRHWSLDGYGNLGDYTVSKLFEGNVILTDKGVSN